VTGDFSPVESPVMDFFEMIFGTLGWRLRRPRLARIVLPILLCGTMYVSDFFDGVSEHRRSEHKCGL
jgi:hypothetical protein